MKLTFDLTTNADLSGALPEVVQLDETAVLLSFGGQLDVIIPTSLALDFFQSFTAAVCLEDQDGASFSVNPSIHD